MRQKAVETGATYFDVDFIETCELLGTSSVQNFKLEEIKMVRHAEQKKQSETDTLKEERM